MNKKLLVSVLLFFFVWTSFLSLNAQWAKTYGGSDDDLAYSIHQTADGGYIVSGSIRSFGAGSYDIWVLKLSSTGAIEWQRTYGGSDDDWSRSIQKTSDGGYIVSGYIRSFGAGGEDIWALKLSSTGAIEWQRTYGGINNDFAYFIQQTSDGGYIVAGNTRSFGSGSADVWILKLSSTGGIEWQRTYGGSSGDVAYSIQQTSDGGYIIPGWAYSFSGSADVWILKLSSTGGIEWQRTYGGSSSDIAYSIQQTSDGGYIVACDTRSFGSGSADVWVLKLSSTGDIEWQRTYGGIDGDYARSIHQTADGGYIVSGYTFSFGAGSYDIWVLKLSSTGAIEWQRTYGGSSGDAVSSIQQTSDGGYIASGYTFSFGAGSWDLLVLKLYSDGSIDSPCGGFIGSLDATIQDTSISPQDTSISPQDTYTSPSDTFISPQDSEATGTDICSTLIISATTGGITDPAPDSYTYYSGTEVQIEAIPNTDYRFSGWSGDVPSGHENDNPLTITMDSDKSITANFIRQYTLTIAAGTGGTTNPVTGNYTHDSGTQVSVTAVPSSEYQFSGWVGDASGTATTITITMDADKSITANFTAISTGDGDSGKKGGCFIATAAYGSLLHPYVKILRDFRDTYLIPTKLGRMLIGLYYEYSPYIAEFIAKHKALKIIVRINLLPIMAFSYLIVHFGLFVTSAMLVFIFMIPIFSVSFFRRKRRRVKAKDPKALASLD